MLLRDVSFFDVLMNDMSLAGGNDRVRLVCSSSTGGNMIALSLTVGLILVLLLLYQDKDDLDLARTR